MKALLKTSFKYLIIIFSIPEYEKISEYPKGACKCGMKNSHPGKTNHWAGSRKLFFFIRTKKVFCTKVMCSFCHKIRTSCDLVK